jgi:hypothetical protein
LLVNKGLFRAVYISSARHGLRDEGLVSLLDVSRRDDAARGITGVLAYHDHAFIQALEGPEPPVNAMFEAFRLTVHLT